MAKLQEAAVAQITEICDRHANDKTPLMMILSDIQNEYGYIPLEVQELVSKKTGISVAEIYGVVQELVSKKTGISVAEIYGVVTFYSFFSLTPKGKYVVGCCLGTACYVKGAQNVIDKFQELLGIKPGETSEDGLFTLDALRCIGACGIAPAVSINGKVYPKVKVDQVPLIIKELKEEATRSRAVTASVTSYSAVVQDVFLHTPQRSWKDLRNFSRRRELRIRLPLTR